MSGEDGSGIVHEQTPSSFEKEIPTSVEIGDKVELKINGIGFWAEVTSSNGHDLEAFSLEALEFSDGANVDIGDELHFNLSNIARCKHPA